MVQLAIPISQKKFFNNANQMASPKICLLICLSVTYSTFEDYMGVVGEILGADKEGNSNRPFRVDFFLCVKTSLR